MSQTTITLTFEQWKAQQAIDGKAVVLDEFVLANVPNLDIDSPIDRAEQLPAAQYIVHRQAVSATGLVNENAVVYSVTMGTEVGDFSFNWVGLINKATGTLAMIVHAPLQSKIKNAEGKQGNVLTRSFLMEYNGAASETQITTPAETWQIDFTARLSGMDERQRLENVDLYGAAAFFGDGFLVTRAASQYSITQGIGYVGGLRCQLPATQNITVTTKPVKVWADVCWKGTLTSVWAEELKITVANTLANYVQDGVQHYVFAVASIDANGVITDLRLKGALSDQQANDALKKHEQSRNHPDGTVNAKGFVQLSSATNSTSEVLAATSKAIKATYDLANGKYTAQDATTTQKGIVQLSSATNSISEAYAATSKAVKAANDNANGRLSVDAGGTVNGVIKCTQEIQATANNSYRHISGSFGCFWRNDGSRIYLMLTDKDDQYGGYNSLRPLVINFATGAVSMENGLSLTEPLSILSGGTGARDAANARLKLGCGTAATMSYSTGDYSSLSGSNTEAATTSQLVGLRDRVTPINRGGTGGNTVASALANLGFSLSPGGAGSSQSGLGGLNVQWGDWAISKVDAGAGVVVTFPRAFPTACVGVFAIPVNAAPEQIGYREYSRTGCTLTKGVGHTGATAGRYFAIGY